MSMPLPQGRSPERPKKPPARPFPDSMACMARYWRIDSGIESRSSPFSRCFFARSLIFARLIHPTHQYSLLNQIKARQTHLFWNQICTERCVMLISAAIRSLTSAVGVGFLLNSSSSVVSWSCVARCLFWFFCCCVRVLFLGGLLAAFWFAGDLTSGSDLTGVAPEAADSEEGEAAEGEAVAGAMAEGSMFGAMAADMSWERAYAFEGTESVGVVV